MFAECRCYVVFAVTYIAISLISASGGWAAPYSCLGVGCVEVRLDGKGGHKIYYRFDNTCDYKVKVRFKCHPSRSARTICLRADPDNDRFGCNSPAAPICENEKRWSGDRDECDNNPTASRNSSGLPPCDSLSQDEASLYRSLGACED